MIGYKNDRYLYFGRVAARVDDVLNYIPARLTGLLLIAVAAILGYDAKQAWAIMRRDAKKAPQPQRRLRRSDGSRGPWASASAVTTAILARTPFGNTWAMPAANWNRSISSRPFA